MKVYNPDNLNCWAAKGIVTKIGAGIVEVQNELGRQVFRLASVVLERDENDATTELRPSTVPRIPHIKNPATGVGFRGSHTKAKFHTSDQYVRCSSRIEEGARDPFFQW